MSLKSELCLMSVFAAWCLWPAGECLCQTITIKCARWSERIKTSEERSASHKQALSRPPCQIKSITSDDGALKLTATVFEKNWFKLNTFAVKNVNIMHFSSEYWELKAGFTRDLQFGQHRLSQHMRGEREEIETLSVDEKWSAPKLQTRIQWQCGPGPISH